MELPIFCVQKHKATTLHYDFRLEINGVLKSWAIPKGPSLDPSEKRLAVQVEDHDLKYARFEGIIPEGDYGAGAVLLWDFGTWEPEGFSTEEAVAQLEQGQIKFKLYGHKLRGSWALVQMKGRGAKNWLLIKHRDEFARPGSHITEEQPHSVLSGKLLEEIS